MFVYLPALRNSCPAAQLSRNAKRPRNRRSGAARPYRGSGLEADVLVAVVGEARRTEVHQRVADPEDLRALVERQPGCVLPDLRVGLVGQVVLLLRVGLLNRLVQQVVDRVVTARTVVLSDVLRVVAVDADRAADRERRTDPGE